MPDWVFPEALFSSMQDSSRRRIYGNCTRLPSSRRIYKTLIKERARTLESFENAVRYGKRALFITREAIDLYGKEAYAYIILDP
ncbi:MAG TPA: hypothetical protein DDW17_06120 [Deltaproteobacteria bacterium]|nr:hypothetical protein [Deltaproteobacteria bacterium]